MDETGSTASDTERSPVMKALRLLAHLARSPEPMALADISRALKLPKPTSYRLARALETSGFVQKDPLTRRYSVGSSFEDVALAALRNGSGHSERRLIMDELAERFGARINVAVLKSGKLILVEWVETTAPLRVELRRETPVPVHCSASGKLLLAFAPQQVRERVLRTAPFAQMTKRTITTAAALKRELEQIRRQGFAVDDQELWTGVNCLAVPVLGRNGDVVAGLAVMAPVAALPLNVAKSRIDELKAAAARISASLAASVEVTKGAGVTAGRAKRAAAAGKSARSG
jgi:DNA-binding IclR family transcriptional regulator